MIYLYIESFDVALILNIQYNSAMWRETEEVWKYSTGCYAEEIFSKANERKDAVKEYNQNSASENQKKKTQNQLSSCCHVAVKTLLFRLRESHN